jgi:ACS family tartrate transporter-like MFS transporter
MRPVEEASPTAVSASSIATAAVSKITWRLVPFLFLLYIIAYLDRINVGFAALQMQGQLGFTNDIYGNGAGAFFLGYFFFQVPSNLILQRLGAKRWICVLMVTWGIISSCMMFVRTPFEFYGMRFLLGLAEAGFFPGVIFYLRSWFPADARARTVAWFMTAGTLSAVVGGPISGALLRVHDPNGLAGWQWMFLMEGIPAVVMGGVVLLYLTDKPEIAGWLSEEHRSWLIGTLEQERQNISVDAPANISSVFKNLNIWLLAITYFGLNTCSYGMSLFLPKMIQASTSVDTFRIGLLTAIPYISATIAMVLFGFHSDRTGERKFHTGLTALAAALCLGGAAYSHSLVPMLILMTLAASFQWSMLGPFWAMPSSFLHGAAAATGIAFINSVGNLGGFFGPKVLGRLGFQNGLLIVGTTIGIGGLMALLVRLPRSVSSSLSETNADIR